MTKFELRSHFRKRRKAFAESLDPAAIADAQDAVAALLESRFTVPAVVAGYAALPVEPDPGPMLLRWRERGHRIALPWFETRDHAMEFREWRGALATGPFGGSFAIDQPGAADPVLLPEMLLVPLVAADPTGSRLGQGGGHYDRALAGLRAISEIVAIGMAWECQIADSLPADPWDEPLDFIVTPERLIECRR